ncbi:MAG: hypothetical protein E7613_09510 [Ruminococcaceae bacterium]|nr:hypothetical protein [Oscillospiraceae bacterium]
MAENNGKNENTYADTHSRIKKIRYLVVILLLVFVVLAVLFYREDLTVENFRYLMKYVDVKPVTFGSSENTQIDFESDSATVTGSFKEDLVVLTKTSVKIYDLSSEEILSDSHSMTSPALSLGDRFFATYDVGAKYVAVYNSFSKLWSNTFDFPVYDVSLDDNGNFCVVTAEKDHTSALKVYNNNFENIFNWRSVDKYSLTADIYSADSDKVYMAVGTMKNTSAGDLLSEVVILSTDSNKVIASLDFNSELIMKVNFNSAGNIVCLTDKVLRIIAPDGSILSDYSFNSRALRKFECGGEWSALLLNENLVGKMHTLIIFGANGDTYMVSNINSEVTDICVSESFAFLLGVEEITVIDLKGKQVKAYPSERSYRSVELLDEKNVYLVYDGMALAKGVEVE